MMRAYEKESTPTMIIWHISCVTNKKSYISVFTKIITNKLDKVMAYGIGPTCTNSHDSLITWLYVVSRQIKNVTSPMDTILDRIVAYDMEKKPQKITPLFVKNSFHAWIFYYLRIAPLILHRATIRLPLLVREKEPLNLYVTLHEINGSFR